MYGHLICHFVTGGSGAITQGVNGEKKSDSTKKLPMPNERYKMMRGIRAFMAGHGLQRPEYMGRT